MSLEQLYTIYRLWHQGSWLTSNDLQRRPISSRPAWQGVSMKACLARHALGDARIAAQVFGVCYKTTSLNESQQKWQRLPERPDLNLGGNLESHARARDKGFSSDLWIYILSQRGKLLRTSLQYALKEELPPRYCALGILSTSSLAIRNNTRAIARLPQRRWPPPSRDIT